MRPHTFGMAGNGHKVAGERNGMHKLTAPRVRWARDGHRKYGINIGSVALVFGIHASTLGKAVRRRTWRRA